MLFGNAEDATIDVEVYDMNQDGFKDLILANRNNQPNYIYLNDGGLNFNKKILFGTGNDNTRAVEIGDFNSDGIINVQDIILVTDNWHMQRALLLFNITMPNIKISPYSIESMYITIEDFFQFDKKTFFLYKEHLKYIVSHIQVIYLWLIN